MIDSISNKIADIDSYEVEVILREMLSVIYVLHAKLRIVESATKPLQTYGGRGGPYNA